MVASIALRPMPLENLSARLPLRGQIRPGIEGMIGTCEDPVSPPQPSPASRGLSYLPGDLLIIMAQIIISVQMVLEEKFVFKHNVHPLRAVGTEGKCRGTGAGRAVYGRNAPGAQARGWDPGKG